MDGRSRPMDNQGRATATVRIARYTSTVRARNQQLEQPPGTCHEALALVS